MPVVFFQNVICLLCYVRTPSHGIVLDCFEAHCAAWRDRSCYLTVFARYQLFYVPSGSSPGAQPLLADLTCGTGSLALLSYLNETLGIPLRGIRSAADVRLLCDAARYRLRVTDTYYLCSEWLHWHVTYFIFCVREKADKIRRVEMSVIDSAFISCSNRDDGQ